MSKSSRRKRTRIEIFAYVHFNPLYRVLRRSARKVARLRPAAFY